jgi:hypothetical protein
VGGELFFPPRFAGFQIKGSDLMAEHDALGIRAAAYERHAKASGSGGSAALADGDNPCHAERVEFRGRHDQDRARAALLAAFGRFQINDENVAAIHG